MSHIVSSLDNNISHPLHFAGARFQEPEQKKKKKKLREYLNAYPKNVYSVFLMFLFSLQKHCGGKLLLPTSPFQLLEHHSLQFELSNNFDAAIHLRARVMYFCS
jgi:hypothetical protein